jgi:hypothetical protein
MGVETQVHLKCGAIHLNAGANQSFGTREGALIPHPRSGLRIGEIREGGKRERLAAIDPAFLRLQGRGIEALPDAIIKSVAVHGSIIQNQIHRRSALGFIERYRAGILGRMHGKREEKDPENHRHPTRKLKAFPPHELHLPCGGEPMRRN